MADDAAPNKPYDSSYVFNGTALAILEDAPNPDIARKLLKDEYESKTWDDPEAAMETAAKFSDYINYKFEGDPVFSHDETIKKAPLEFDSIPNSDYASDGEASEETDVKRINAWAETNKKLITHSDITKKDTDTLLDREKLLRSIDDTASYLRRQRTSTNESWLTNFYERAKYGVAGGILNAVGATDTAKSLYEATDPNRDEDFSSRLASGAGRVGPGALLNLVPGVGTGASLAYFGASGVGDVRDRYNNALKDTGDASRAWKAAAFESGAQALSIAAGVKLGRGATAASRAEGTALSRTIKAGTEFTAISTAAYPLERGAQWESTNRPLPDFLESLRTNAIDAMTLGVLTHGVTEAPGALKRTLNRPPPPQGEPSPQQESPVVATPEETQPAEEAQQAEGPAEAPQGFSSIATEKVDINPEPVTEHLNSAEDIPAQEISEEVPHSFETEDGTKYYVSNGTTQRINENGSKSGATDHTFYADESVADAIDAARNTRNRNGTLPKIYVAKGKLRISDIDPDHPAIAEEGSPLRFGKNSLVLKPKVSDAPGEGLYPVMASRIRSKGTKNQLRVIIGSKISKVHEAQNIASPEAVAEKAAIDGSPSVGAQAAFNASDLVQGKAAQRIGASPGSASHVRFMIAEGLGQYLPKTNKGTKDAADVYVEKNGWENSFNKINERGENDNSLLLQSIAAKLFDEANTASKSAEEAGDLKASEEWGVVANKMFRHLDEMNREGGQITQYNAFLQKVNPTLWGNATLREARTQVTRTVTAEKGISPAIHAEVISELARTKAALNYLLEEGKANLAKEPKPKKVEGQPAPPEKKPEEGLPPDRKRKAEQLKSHAEKLEEKVKDVEKEVNARIAKIKPDVDAAAELLGEAQKLGPGQFRDELLRKAFEKQAKANTTKGEAPKDEHGNFLYRYWLLNKISSLGTLGVKLGGDAQKFIQNTASFSAKGIATGDPLRGARYLVGFAKGLYNMGFRASSESFTKGLDFRKSEIEDPYARPKLDEPTKRSIFGSDILHDTKGILRNVGWIQRVYEALDNAYFVSNQEGAANVYAHDVAKRSGLRGEALRAAIADKLYNTTENFKAAKSKAEYEAKILKDNGIEVTPRQTRLRAAEIVQQMRDPEVMQAATGFAWGNLFSRPPDGPVGSLIKAVKGVSNVEFAIGEHGVKALKPELSFLNTLGNLINFSKESVPFFNWSFLNNKLSPLEREVSATNMVLGGLMMGGLLAKAVKDIDNPNASLAIYGSGPADKKKRATWAASGGKPWSLRVGNTVIDYKDSIFSFMLGGLGQMSDNMRNNKDYEIDHAVFAFGLGMANSIIHRSFLQHLGNFMDAVERTDVTGMRDAIDSTKTLVINEAKGLIPFEGTWRSFARALNSPIEAYQDSVAKMVQGIPALQATEKPQLNFFGEPIEQHWENRIDAVSRFYTERTTDPDIRWLTDNGYSIEIPWRVNIPGIKKASEKAQDREDEYGSTFGSVLTPSEHYDLVKEAGPKIRDLVAEYRGTYGDAAFSDRVQHNLSIGVNRIIKQTERELFTP